MRLAELVPAERVIVPLEAASVQGATELLAERLIATGAVAEPNRFRVVVQNARPEDWATVGEHAFLPHFRTEAVRSVVAALGIASAPISSARDPQRAARVVILVVAPPRETTTYLQVMGAFARALNDPDNLAALLRARTAAEVAGLAAFAQLDLPSHLLVRDVMASGAVTAGPDLPLGAAARLLVERGLHALPVVDESGSLLGMVTDRDVLRFLIPAYLQRSKSGEFRAPTKTELRGVPDPRLVPIKEVMARTVLCLAEDQALGDVATLTYAKDIDSFPVVREGKVIGLLTRHELVRRLIAL